MKRGRRLLVALPIAVILAVTAGVTFAVKGDSSSNDAATAQYDEPQPPPPGPTTPAETSPGFVKGAKKKCYKRKKKSKRHCTTTGTAGNDRIKTSRRYKTKVRSGGGDDHIDARNGRRDTIYCGDGKDTVQADPEDQVSPSCENVTRG